MMQSVRRGYSAISAITRCMITTRHASSLPRLFTNPKTQTQYEKLHHDYLSIREDRTKQIADDIWGDYLQEMAICIRERIQFPLGLRTSPSECDDIIGILRQKDENIRVSYIYPNPMHGSPVHQVEFRVVNVDMPIWKRLLINL